MQAEFAVAETNRLDYRTFLSALLTASAEVLESKISLLFELYDLDRSGTLSLTELTQIFMHASPLQPVRLNHLIKRSVQSRAR